MRPYRLGSSTHRLVGVKKGPFLACMHGDTEELREKLLRELACVHALEHSTKELKNTHIQCRNLLEHKIFMNYCWCLFLTEFTFFLVCWFFVPQFKPYSCEPLPPPLDHCSRPRRIVKRANKCKKSVKKFCKSILLAEELR